MASKAVALSPLGRLQPIGSHWACSIRGSPLIQSPYLMHHPTRLSRLQPLSQPCRSNLLNPIIARSYSSRRVPKAMSGHTAKAETSKEGLGKSIRSGITDEMMERGGSMLFPHTFIMPTGDNLPSLFKEPKLRFKLEWRRFKWVVFRPAMMYYFRFRHNIKLQKTTMIKDHAYAMYRNMNSWLASGNLEELRKICLPELVDEFTRQIKSRPHNEALHWTFHRLMAPLKVVSDLTVPMPDSNVIVRQVVFKIVSSQSLEKVTRGPRGSPPVNYKAPLPKVVTEYFVLCQTNVGEGRPWRVWGTTEETTPEQLKLIEWMEAKQAAGESLE